MMKTSNRRVSIEADSATYMGLTQIATTDFLHTDGQIKKGLSPYTMEEVVRPVIAMRKEMRETHGVEHIRLRDILSFALQDGIVEHLITYSNSQNKSDDEVKK